MSKWLTVDMDKLNRPRTVEFRGRTMTVMPTPYDLPRSVRSLLSDDGSKVVIEIEYLDHEPEITALTDMPWLTLSLGKHSGRVFKIILDATHFTSRSEVLEGMSRALQTEESRGKRPEPATQGSYEITRSVVSDRFAELQRAVTE